MKWNTGSDLGGEVNGDAFLFVHQSTIEVRRLVESMMEFMLHHTLKTVVHAAMETVDDEGLFFCFLELDMR